MRRKASITSMRSRTCAGSSEAPQQCQLVGEDSLGPLAEAVLHEGLRVRMAIVGDHHVGLTGTWWTEDVHLSCELDLIPRLLLEVGEKVVVEATILWSYD